MTPAELRALLASRESRKADHSPACSCQDCDHAQYALEQAAVNALPALLDVAEAADRVVHDEEIGWPRLVELRAALLKLIAVTK